MKTSLNVIVAAEKPLENLLTKEHPVKVSWKLGSLAIEVEKYLSRYYTEKDKLIMKYGVANEENPEQVSVDRNDEETFKKFVDDLNELMSEEVDIEGYEPLNLNDLGEISIKPMDLAILRDFFTNEV